MDNNQDELYPSALWTSLEEMDLSTQGEARKPLPPLVPKPIKHVVFDLDDTIWSINPGHIISSCEPIGTTDKDILVAKVQQRYYQVDEKGEATPIVKEATAEIKLDPTLRATLDTLKDKGIKMSVASANTKASALKALDAFGLTKYFDQIEANWSQSKADMVKKIAQKDKTPTEEMMFINDAFWNVTEVGEQTGAMAVIAGYDIANISEILEYIE